MQTIATAPAAVQLRRDAAAVIAGYSGRVPDPWLAGEGVKL